MADDRKITITFNEMCDAQSRVVATMVWNNPGLILMQNELCDAMSMLLAILFEPSEKREPSMEKKRQLLRNHFGAVDLSDRAVNVLYEDYFKCNTKEE